MSLAARMAQEAEAAVAAMQEAALRARGLHARSELMRHMATTAAKALAGGQDRNAAADLVAREWMQAWALGDGTAGLDDAARGFIAAHLDAATGRPDADAALAGALDMLDRALAASGRTLADEMAWRSECAHGWWGMVRPPPPGLLRRPSIPAPDPGRPFWTACCAPHCKGRDREGSG